MIRAKEPVKIKAFEHSMVAFGQPHRRDFVGTSETGKSNVLHRCILTSGGNYFL
jgi:hypothetical protein